jgi:dihydropteroate synthase
MIQITRNNFDNWIDVIFKGKLIDNTKTEAQAVAVAKRIQKEEKQSYPILIYLKKEKIL